MTRFINLFFFFVVFSFTSSIYAQKSQTDTTLNNGTNSIYFKSSAFFKCNIKLPINYNPQKKYILVTGLHGGGDSPEQFITIWDSLNITDFIYAVHQAPYSWLFDQKIGYDWALWPTEIRY